MSTEPKDGGPALDGRTMLVSGWLSLRDYFAAGAMQGLLDGRWGSYRDNLTDDEFRADLVAESYRTADAMLAQRERKT